MPDSRHNTQPPPTAGRPLLVTAEPLLLDELLRLAGTAGVGVDVAPDLGAVAGRWADAALVIVGADPAQGGGLPPPARPGVVLVSADVDDGAVWERAVSLGAEHVVFLPDGEAWLVDMLREAAAGPVRPGTMIAVAGARGGAGATSLAIALALAGARAGMATLLVDADPLGGGIDLALGVEDSGGLRWPDLAGARGRLSGRRLADALPVANGVAVLSFDRSDPGDRPDEVLGEAAGALLDAALRSHDLVVVDLPRRPGPVACEALVRAATALLVVPAEVRACAAGARVARLLAAGCADVRAVVRGPAPAGIEPPLVAAALGLPLAGAMAADRGLAGSLERGEPPGSRPRGPLGRLAGVLLVDLGVTAAGRGAARVAVSAGAS